eukprot:CAMPEP_0119376078 /NCGR_PEP_ID=MMETSP1334-20130426/38666_1 /TAXON_ID=127549 /ORGANISM="Calcidiscus leptoporus, Strain RCC1130" /LENGTH=44 /DNA_ID= /DNA_START= /DNA_END= /DNA_ORIENTATION=
MSAMLKCAPERASYTAVDDLRSSDCTSFPGGGFMSASSSDGADL